MDTTVTDPTPTDPGVSDPGTTDTPVGAGCHTCLVPGIAFRFSKLDVTEPSYASDLPKFLNAIWAPDIDAYRLNVLLQL